MFNFSSPKAKNSRILLIIILAILVLLSYIIIRPFLIPLISAFILAYLCLPLYKKLERTLPKPLSAIICILLVIIILILPMGTLIGGLTNQTSSYLQEKPLKTLLSDFSTLPFIENLNLDLTSLTEKTLTFLVSLFTSALSLIPTLIISLIITLFGMYYILTNWPTLTSNLTSYIPFKNKKKVASEIAQVTNSIVYGTILIAAIEFVVAVIGFYLSGVKPFLLLPSIIFFLAFIPGLGPTFVWLPAALYFIFFGPSSTAVGVIITGLVLSFGIDAVLRGKILGSRSHINPLIMLVGILGGISVFGIFGFVIGPLILVYTIELLEETLQES